MTISQITVKHTISSLILVLLMVGCTSPSKPTVNLNSAKHQLSLNQHQNWLINGKIGFKSSTKKQSANFRWEQQQDHYQLNLTSIIGTSLLNLKGQDGEVELIADDEHYYDTDPARLIWRVTGWNIPVTQLRYWIKGQHQTKDQALLSEQGWVSQLVPICDNCEGWLILYDNYKMVNTTWLPHKVVLKNQENNSQLLIRINEWNL